LKNQEPIPDLQDALSRLAGRRLRSALRDQPAAALLGPRQVGKTTLARSLRGTYFDLELETDRLRLDLEWEQLVESKRLLVLDEAQAFPEIFPRLAATRSIWCSKSAARAGPWRSSSLRSPIDGISNVSLCWPTPLAQTVESCSPDRATSWSRGPESCATFPG
jgi:hypothetical protein